MPSRSSVVSCAQVFAVVMALHFAVAAQSTPAQSGKPILKPRAQRTSPTDLEISGDIVGVPAGATRYVTREDLQTLPQVTFTVSDDTNFTGPTQVRGVLLEDLDRALASAPDADLVVAVCDDQYHAHYPRAYLVDHHPLLVLEVSGQPPQRWPKSAEGDGQSMGPYMISHREFTPGSKILAHRDEPQVPWGVVRIEFQKEKEFFDRIAPRGPKASDADVQAGFRISRQNCLRCHNAGDAGGLNARHPWLVLSAWAVASPQYFGAYVRNPQGQNPQAKMYPNPEYDDATLQALIAYFQTFSRPEKP